MKARKVPQRMCTGCSEMKPKKELIRIVKNNEDLISMDLTGKKPGRGAYICKNLKCLEQAFKTKRLEKNLGVKINDEIYNNLRDQISNNNCEVL